MSRPAPSPLASDAEAAEILIVDDQDETRRALARLVRARGYRTLQASSGVEALEILAQRSVDLVLLDLFMPGMDGYDVLSRVQDDPRLAPIPVVMISGAQDTMIVARCVERGADDFLYKPFEPALLSARLHSSLAKKRLRDLERRYLEYLEREGEKSQSLIDRLLPAPIAARLREGEGTVAEKFDDVSVLFADLVGFTPLAGRMEPVALVDLLNRV
ncbi:MAG: response regulator, partial [Myxococcales bacterium]|nr:response regulator [Myxococcales bacterium]